MQATPRPAPFIGVVSDTHSHYDEALDELLAGADRIIHAGDVGTIDVLARLRALAPVTAVMGNTDIPFWEDDLPWEAEVEALGLRILVCHIGKSLMGRHDPVAEGFDLVISPVAPDAAPPYKEQVEDQYSYTVPYSLGGNPAVVVRAPAPRRTG